MIHRHQWNISPSVEQAADELLRVCEKHGLCYDDWVAWFNDEPYLIPALDWMFDRSKPVPNRRLMRDLVSAVESHIDVSDETVQADLSSIVTKAARKARSVFVGIVFVLSGWIVVGSIFTGQNDFAKSTSVTTTLIVLIVAILWLAFLEAAHIGAVALSTADVSELGSTRPRLVKLHKYIDNKSKLEKYLAARQVGVVLTVFLISAVTRTPTLRFLPWTNIAIPTGLGILFEIGFPGAILVLIIGQVFPQILTARMPAKLMNTVFMAGAFHATRLIGKLNLAEPASWFAAMVKGCESIPSAARERFIDMTTDEIGYGTQIAASTVVITGGYAQIKNVESVDFHTGSYSSININLATIPDSVGQVSFPQPEGEILRGGEKEPVPVVISAIVPFHEKPGKPVRYYATVSPRFGNFHSGDTLKVTSVLEYTGKLDQVIVPIDRLTKIAFIRILMTNPPQPLPPAELEIFHGAKPGDVIMIEPQILPDNSVQFVSATNYPVLDSTLELHWQNMDDMPAKPKIEFVTLKGGTEDGKQRQSLQLLN